MLNVVVKCIIYIFNLLFVVVYYVIIINVDFVYIDFCIFLVNVI